MDPRELKSKLENLEIPPWPQKGEIMDACGVINPHVATPKQTETMRFFLNTAMPHVDPDLPKKRKANPLLTHKEHFGKHWVVEMATAVMLVEDFSDTTNIKENIKVEKLGLDKKGKKRGRLHDKKEKNKLTTKYQKLCVKFHKKDEDKHAMRRMQEWDEIIGEFDKHRAAANNNQQQQLDSDDEENDNHRQSYMAFLDKRDPVLAAIYRGNGVREVSPVAAAASTEGADGAE